MKVSRKGGDCGVRIGDKVVEQVEEMEYLGVMIIGMVGWRRKCRQGLGVLRE